MGFESHYKHLGFEIRHLGRGTLTYLLKGLLCCAVSRLEVAMVEEGMVRMSLQPWLGSSVGWSVIRIQQGCGFNLRSGHIQESTNECIKKWNNKLMSVCLSLSLKINK